ncbi:MAG: hypothetical protein JWP75_2783, partial [Frondihabitans sp.]|nr:hypothetical protein [Frondihabitans sp.]
TGTTPAGPGTSTTATTATSGDTGLVAAGLGATTAVAADSSLAFTGSESPVAPLAAGFLLLLLGGLFLTLRRRTHR